MHRHTHRRIVINGYILTNESTNTPTDAPTNTRTNAALTQFHQRTYKQRTHGDAPRTY